MFQQIHALVQSVEKLTITLSAGVDGKMKVCVIPSIANGKNAALAQPLVLLASPEELDAGFFDAISQYQTARLSLAEQVAATAVIIDAAKKAQEALAVKTIKGKPATAKASEKSEPDEREGDDDSDGESGDQVVTTAKPVVSASKPVAPASTGTDLSDLI